MSTNKLEMSPKRNWLSAVKRESEKNPLASNVVFGLFLTGLEKLVEYEFVCPCNPKQNAPFAAGFFVVPAFLAFLLMTNIRAWRSVRCSKECVKNLLISSGITMVWLTLVFMDGNYFVCGMTNWSGKYESVPEAAPRKWCKPATNSTELLTKSQKWFTLSQGIGLGIITFLACAYLLQTMISCCCRKKENEDESSNQVMEKLRMNPEQEGSVPYLPESN